MKLTETIKNKIDQYFDGINDEDFVHLVKHHYGFEIEPLSKGGFILPGMISGQIFWEALQHMGEGNFAKIADANQLYESIPGLWTVPSTSHLDKQEQRDIISQVA